MTDLVLGRFKYSAIQYILDVQYHTVQLQQLTWNYQLWFFKANIVYRIIKKEFGAKCDSEILGHLISSCTHSAVSPGLSLVLLAYTLVRGKAPRKGYFLSFRNTFSTSFGSVRNTYHSRPSRCLQIGPKVFVQLQTLCCMLCLEYFAEYQICIYD